MKNIALILISMSALLASLTYVYVTLVQPPSRHALAYSEALEACSNKIPDIETSAGKIQATQDNNNSYLTGLFNNPDTTSFGRYPAFDRCLATKGQAVR